MQAIAYRMLGSFSDAEELVQDAYLRWHRIKLGQVNSPSAYLSRIIWRLCIDRARRRKIEKCNYVGPWLPEPVNAQIASRISDPGLVHEQADSINMAFMVLLEKLNPLERAVFILREAFDTEHQRIAEILAIKAAHSRQLYRRATNKVAMEKRHIHGDHVGLIQEFLEAAQTGNLDRLNRLMTDDIVAYSDGGGRASAAIIPLVGRDRVLTVLLHLLRNQDEPLTYHFEEINSEPGLIIRAKQGIHSTHCIALDAGKIHRMYTIRNPNKLTYV